MLDGYSVHTDAVKRLWLVRPDREQEPLYRMREALHRAGISAPHYYAWVRDGKVPEIPFRDDNQWRLFTEHDISMLKTCAALEAAELSGNMETGTAWAKAFAQIAPIKQRFEMLVRLSAQQADADRTSALRFDAARGELRVAALSGDYDPQSVMVGDRCEGGVGWFVLEHGSPVMISQGRASQQLPDNLLREPGDSSHSLSIPLLDNETVPVGVLNLTRSKAHDPFAREDQEMWTSLGQILGPLLTHHTKTKVAR